jgi:hypothetical protein
MILDQDYRYDSTHHPSHEQLIGYFDGKLSQAAHESLQAHLVDCNHCLEVFQDVRDFFEIHGEDDEVITEGRFSAWTALWRRICEEANEKVHRADLVPKWRMNALTTIAIAAMLLVAVGLGIWVLRQRSQEQNLTAQLARIRQENAELQANQQNLAARTKELEEQNLQLQERARAAQSGTPESNTVSKPELNPPIYDLYPRNFTQRSGAQNEVNRIKVPASANSIILILNGEGLAGASNYGVEIVNEQGKSIWRARGLIKGQLGNLTLKIDRSFIGPGAYRLNLYGPGGWTSRALAEYVMRIE